MWKRLSVLWVVVRGDARVLWHALKHPQSPGWLKWATAGMALYLVSPVDLLPDMIPVIGVVDDIVLIALALRWIVKKLPPQIRQAAERAAGRVPDATVVDDAPR
jgi:uncharacterized membrane protein YkvA (DUF1232 family)